LGVKEFMDFILEPLKLFLMQKLKYFKNLKYQINLKVKMNKIDHINDDKIIDKSHFGSRMTTLINSNQLDNKLFDNKEKIITN
jgi:hypothetical protein